MLDALAKNKKILEIIIKNYPIVNDTLTNRFAGIILCLSLLHEVWTNLKYRFDEGKQTAQPKLGLFCSYFNL